MPDNGEWLSVTALLDTLEADHDVRLYRSNLQGRTEPGPTGKKISVLEALAGRQPALARQVAQGGRTVWEVSKQAIPELVARAVGRPGPRPGLQISLDAGQILRFAAHIVATGDGTAVREALVAAGIPEEHLKKGERVVIPFQPRPDPTSRKK